MMGLICLLFVSMHPAWAESNISDTYKYAWSETTGWHNWKATNGQATAGSTYLVGYVWAERIGWIKLGSTHEGGTYPNTTSTNWGVNRDVATGALSGYAWSENAGWINFNPTHGGVTISTSTNKFDGYAWGERIGWIHFQNAPPEYYVMQEASAPTVTTQAVGNIGTTTATSNGTITALGAPHPTAHGVCWALHADPTVDDDKDDRGAASNTGEFTADITGLTPGATYHVRAFATNDAGTSYGEDVEFSTIPTYAVTYNGNGATSGTAPADQTKTHDVDLTLAENTDNLARTGYAFVGWNTQADGLGTDYAAGGTYTANEAVTLYAKWTANAYTVTFDANGGTAPNPGTKEVTYDATYGALATTTRDGHAFNGWFTQATGGTQVTASTTVTTASDHTLYAQWGATPTRYVCSDGNCGGHTPCHRTLREAVGAATTSGTILIAAEDQDGNFSLAANINLTLQGGWDATFKNPNSGTTTLHGAPKAPQGSLIFQTLSIKP